MSPFVKIFHQHVQRSGMSKIQIYSIEIVNFGRETPLKNTIKVPVVQLKIKCSNNTCLRALARDIGRFVFIH